jgi:ABC-type nitrate/sulfonate/bicarbonate transport system substrate-binding protein
MIRRLLAMSIALLGVMLMMPNANGDTFEQQLGDTKVGSVDEAAQTQVPFITWGGDVATFVANGGLTTTKDSIYGKDGLNLKLVNGDDFHQQVRDYLSGKSPYLRGTLGMVSLASEVMNKDPRTKPVIILQLTWSAGDHLVGRDNLKNLNQLKGKKVCLQKGGPHLTLIDDSLKAAGLKWEDITVVWAKNLTGPDSPGEMFKKDSTIDACCVISPDMIGLCSAIDQVGSGAEGTVKGAHVVNSTASMSHSIADVYVVRSDYFQKRKADVQKFVVGYMKATEQLLDWKKNYNDGKGKSAEYTNALKLAQQIYGAKVLPTLENDAHGLVCDATFVRIPGNEAFFDDPNNLTGFDQKTSSALETALKLGFVGNKFGFVKAGWDYKELSTQAGVQYQKPVFATGRVKGEVTDFTKDLDTNTIFSFEIKFEPEQNTFNIDTYAADFKRVADAQATFGNCVILVRGHSDPTLALQNFFWAARAKGLITGDSPNFKFDGKPLNLADTATIVTAIQNTNLANQNRVNTEGKTVPIDDPKVTVAAALQLSQTRAEKVLQTFAEYAKGKGYTVDLSQIRPQGVGIAEPINPRPRNMAQAKENMRVEFRIIRVRAENLKPDDFDFDKK